MAGEDTTSRSNVRPGSGAGNVDDRVGDPAGYPADNPAHGMSAESFEAFVDEVAQFRDTAVAPNVARWETEKRMAPEALR